MAASTDLRRTARATERATDLDRVDRSARLHLLGSFWLTLDGDAHGLPLGGQRILAALALRGRLSRTRLAGLLWPDTRPAQAQTNVRHALWRLAQATGGTPLVASHAGELHLDARVGTDVGVLVAGAHHASGDGGDAPVGWLADLLRPEAVDLLPDWDDEWLHVDRERMRQLRLHVLDQWARRLTEASDFGLALEVALSALHTDVLRESAHRAVIRVHLAEGNVQEARRSFAYCRSVLAAEIGVAPSPATAALVP